MKLKTIYNIKKKNNKKPNKYLNLDNNFIITKNKITIFF